MIKYDNALSLLFSTCCCLFVSVFGLLEIKDLIMPREVRLGSLQEIIMDCEYESENVTGIEVKWFYNGGKDQIYQWIPGHGVGVSMGSLKDHIDATFQTTNDEKTMYRGLKLTNVTTELTGNYTCKVSGFTEEATLTKNLTVYVPPSEELNLTVIPEELRAICSVNGVFPEPSISLMIRKWNSTENAEIEEEAEKELGLYNKASTITFSNDTLSSASEFICVMRIPGTSYELTKSEILSKDNFSIRMHLDPWLLQFCILFMFLH